MPINTERCIKDADASISLRCIEIVALILEDCAFGKYSKTVSEATRNEELPMVVFGQFYGYMLTVCRTAFSDVNGYIQNCTFYATNKLTLGEGRSLKVKSSHHSIRTHTLIILHEVNLANFLIKFSLAERLEEIASGILEYLWFDDYNVLNGGLYNVHINNRD